MYLGSLISSLVEMAYSYCSENAVIEVVVKIGEVLSRILPRIRCRWASFNDASCSEYGPGGVVRHLHTVFHLESTSACTVQCADTSYSIASTM